jgi:hypothetical protein
MEDIENKRAELEEAHNEVLKLGESLISKDSIIKNLWSSKKFLSQELDTANNKIGVLESDHKLLKVAYDKAMARRFAQATFR